MRRRFEKWQGMERFTPRTPRGVLGTDLVMARNGLENSPRLPALRGVCGECFGIRFVPVHGIGVPSRGVRGVEQRQILGIRRFRGELRGEFAGSSKQLPAASGFDQKRFSEVCAARQLPAHFRPVVERISGSSRGVRGVFPSLRTRARVRVRARDKKARKTPRDSPHSPRDLW